MRITLDRELFLLTLLVPPLTHPRLLELDANDRKLIEIVTRRFRLHEPKEST